MRTIVAAVAVAALCVGSAAAELDLQSARWQVVGRSKQESKAADVAAIPVDAQAKLLGRLHAKIKMLNRGPAVEGVLLRYALTAQIIPAGPSDATLAPTWAVPFVVDEKRVPKIGANQYIEVDLDPTAALSLCLRRLENGGYAPKAIKLEVMAEPRKGQPASRRLESIVPVETGS